MDSCPSCCPTCAAKAVASAAEDSRYGSTNMLPAGTIEFMLTTRQICDHMHADDGWHPFSGERVISYLTDPSESTICDDLDYLVVHRYILASYRLHGSADCIYVRIYLIPFDLSGVDGKLLLRNDAISKPARLYLRRLLPTIDRNPAKWQGVWDGLSLTASPFLFSEPNNRTMAEIYSNLPSPLVLPPSTSRLGRIARRILSGHGPEGLSAETKLYQYQRRTVVAMLQREIPKERIEPFENDHLVDIFDPLYIPIVGISGETFYLQPAKLIILRDRPRVSAPRGGILCEELGTGKTVMVLALILATLDDLPSPETSIYQRHQPVIMTPLAFRHFPSEFENERKRVLTGKNNIRFPEGPRVPSLVDILLHHLRVPQNGFQPIVLHRHQEEFKARRLYESQMANTPFYHQEISTSPEDNRTKRCSERSILPPRVMFITSATLVVVPNSLLGQWYSEIHKHCDDSIRVLELRRTTPMPPAQDLASQYDIIIMTSHRFSAEATKKGVGQLHSRPICRCPPFDRTLVPDCKCPSTPDVSPLLQIRWKRLVIDEGHVSASLSTNVTPFAQTLSVERRWIVSGTPTTNLLGLTFGQSSEVEAKGDDEFETGLYFERGVESVDISETESSIVVARKWTKYDREDLRKLNNMATYFIGVPHFKANPGIFSISVTAALFGPQGIPEPGAIRVLEQVMKMVMIRHRTEDVEKDIILPPIQQETILLDLDPYAVKSYNALQANIVANAIDSERKDIDYFFHPRNAVPLRTVVENMSQLLFWFTDSNMFNVVEMHAHAEDTLKRAIERKLPSDDVKLLQQAHHHIRLALEDPMWRAIQTHEDAPYLVFDMPLRVFKAWTRTPASVYPFSLPSLTGLMHPDRLVKLRDIVLHRPLISEEPVIEWGIMTAEKDRKQRMLVEEEDERNVPKKKRKYEMRDVNNQSKAIEWAKRGARADMIQEIRIELAKVLKKMEEFDGTNQPPSPAVTRNRKHVLPLSILSRVRVGSSCSTKLNYILNEVLQYATEEKFLIFSNSPLTLSHVAEGLELIQVKYLQFTTQVVPQDREQFVTTFESSDTYRVFLMELKHGARGLNLVSASRVIFCEPVWQADVESQAIKRVHRIGQMKPVTVKTLAIRATAEEAMMSRREALKGKDGRLPKMTEEVGMRHFIANPRFIEAKPLLLSTLEIPLMHRPMDISSDTSVDIVEEAPTPSYNYVPFRFVADTLPPKKKPRITVVRFAD